MRKRPGKVSRNQAQRRQKQRRLMSRVDYQQLETRRVLAAAPYHPNELLVQFHPQDASTRAAIRQSIGAEILETVHTGPMIQAGLGALERVRVGNGLTVEDAIAQFENIPGVKFAEPNFVVQYYDVSDDTHYVNGDMWSVFSDDTPTSIGPSGTTNVFGSQAEKVWDGGSIGSKDVYVAIFDSGTDISHPDLVDNIFNNPFDPIDGVDNDGNGKVDDFNGWDFGTDDNEPEDNIGHGTHVSGTVGARGGNGIGVVGINWEVSLIPCKLGDAPSVTSAINALDYIIDLKQRHGLNIVASNNSWGGGGFSQALLDAIVRSANADILVVCAAGNDSSDNDSVPQYPANYDTSAEAGYDAVISVASLDSTGDMSSFSNFGATTVDLAAPGSDIWSTIPGNGYESNSGTSMASPHVAGAVGLFASVNPGATAAEIRDALFNSVTATPSLDGLVVTGGRLDLSKLVVSVGPDASIDDVSTFEGNSGTKALEFTVTLAEAWPEQVSIDYATSSLTATSGVDFQAKTGTVIFAPGELTRTISVNIIGDLGYEPDENFRVTLTKGVNAKLDKKVGLGTIVNDDPHVVGETGVLVNLNSTWKTFTFKRPYVDPVVIMGTPSTLRGDSVTIRVKNVKPAVGAFNGSFEARVEEWDYLDGVHGTETVSYMVFERGRHVLQNGAVIVAGTSTANHRFGSYTFGSAAKFTKTPVVLTQVMTAKEASAVTPRIKDVSKTGFSMRLQEEEASDRIHLTETFGWVAIEPGRKTGGGFDSEVGITPTVVTDQNYRINFQPEFSRRPAFFAQMQTFNGGDPAVVRYRQLSYRSAQIFLEEERSADSEVAHNAESVGYLALQVGLIVDDPTGQMPSAMQAQPGGGGLEFVLAPNGEGTPPSWDQLSAAAFAAAGSPRLEMRRNEGAADVVATVAAELDDLTLNAPAALKPTRIWLTGTNSEVTGSEDVRDLAILDQDCLESFDDLV